MRMPLFLAIPVVAVLGLVAGACFGGDDDEDFSDITGSATAAAERTPSPSPTDGASASPSPSPTDSARGTPQETNTATATATTPAATETATAAPLTPTPAATSDPTADYIAAARSGGQALKAAVVKLKDDMFASQTRQDDPATAELLRSDIAVVDGHIASLRALQPPASMAAFAADLEAAMAEIKRGTEALTRAINNNDQLAGLTAFTALNNGEAALDDALAQLP